MSMYNVWLCGLLFRQCTNIIEKWLETNLWARKSLTFAVLV